MRLPTPAITTGPRAGSRCLYDQLAHVDGLAHACAAEQAHLAALRKPNHPEMTLMPVFEQILTAGLLVVGRAGR